MTATKLKLGFSALVVAGTATALVIQHQAQEKLRAEDELLRQQIAQLKTDNANLSNRVPAKSNSESLPNDQFNELLKLRGEVGVLRRQLELKNAKVVQQATSSGEIMGTAHKSGSYIAKGQLVNAGFDTPEAATETYLHAIWSGDFQQLTNAQSAHLLAGLNALNDSKGQEAFEKKFREQDIASGIQGIQLLAKKVSEDRVDLEVLVFEEGKPPGTVIVKIAKEGNLWKFDGNTSVSTWESAWKDGYFQSLTPFSNQ